MSERVKNGPDFCHVDASPCLCCGSVEAPRLFAVTVDGAPLRVSVWLCPEHGDGLLLRIGYAVGEFLQDNGADWPRP